MMAQLAEAPPTGGNWTPISQTLDALVGMPSMTTTAMPRYAVLTVRGEAHEQMFEVECDIPELGIRSQGSGTSRRSAEQEAAREAYGRATQP